MTPVRSALLAAALATVCASGPLAAQDGPPFPLEGLVITASPTPRPARSVATHVTVLDGEDLRAGGATRVVDALRGVPGLNVVQNGSFGASTSVFLRGGESDYVLVLIDGVQVNQPGGAFDFSGLTLENVERIEVVRGGASALYGSDAVSGVINVITRTGRGGARGTLSLRTGSYGRRAWAADLSGGAERTAYSLSLARDATDGILARNNRFENMVLSGSVRLAPDERTQASVTLRVADREYHFPTDGSGNVVDDNAFTYADETTVGIQASRRLSDRVTLEGFLAHAETDGGTDDAPDGPADTLGFYGFTSLDHVRRSSADVRANVALHDAVLSVGGELEEQSQRSFTESLSQFGPSAGRSEYRRSNRAGYAHLTGESGGVGYNAGLRLEDNERYGTSWSWQMGASVRVARDLRLRASASRAIKEPGFFETFATGFARGNPDLDPERSLQWEAGADATVAGLLTLRATWFDQAFDDLIQYTGAPPTPQAPNYFNVARAAARGLEFQAEVARAGWRARGGWTWLDTEVVDPGLDDGPGAEFVAGEGLLRRPRHTLSADLTRVVSSGASVSAGVRRVGERADRDFSTFPAGRIAMNAYTVVHAGAEFDLAALGSVVVRGDNLLDADYQEVLGFRAPGRSFSVGVRVALGGT